ncbi:RTM1 [Pyrenophora seminiperda CCB06]|uniref:RTM1 n=1 Tax=Pyrenophora seminiperda CCB06 TaxID=1302712 RepID=A0A3M7MBV6_9PLEO|nr:RTM1 [Pyrenophora seminiperda CCB06]
MTDQRVAKRKTHTKSRKGCFQCKTRHTKCNEARPRCGNCLRLDIHCTFPTIPESYTASPQTSTSPSVTSPYVDSATAESPDTAPNSSELPIADLRLLHHWTKTCAKTLHPNPANRTSAFQNEFVELGFEYPFLLRGFLALSAVHHASLLPQNDRQGLLLQADSHISRALDTYRKNLEAPKAELAIPMFMLSSILLIYNFGSAQLQSPEDPISALHHCFRLLQGIKVVVLPHWQQIKNSAVFAHMTDNPLGEALKALDVLAKEENPQEILRLKELTELLLDSQDKEACATAIDELHSSWLRFRYLSPERDEYSILFLWPSQLNKRFLDLFVAHNPVTCIITTHFAAMLAQCRPVWWVGKWPQWLLAASEQLLAATPDLLNWLNWPRQIINSSTQTTSPSLASVQLLWIAVIDLHLLHEATKADSERALQNAAQGKPCYMYSIENHPALNDPNVYVLYRYTPSRVAAIIFIVAFALTTFAHIFQLFQKRTWYFTPLIVGGLFETIGFIGRFISHNDIWALGPFIMQSLLILLAPALFAASIYIILGRIILLVDGERYSLVRQKWLTKLFVAGDIFSFFLQGTGAWNAVETYSFTEC